MKKYMIDYTEGSVSGCDNLFDTREDAQFHMNTFYTKEERKGLEVVEVDITFTHPINNEQDIKAFFRHLVHDLKINFHPDDDFRNYVNYETHERTMDDATAEHYNDLMERCFAVMAMDDREEEVYNLAYDIVFGHVVENGKEDER